MTLAQRRKNLILARRALQNARGVEAAGGHPLIVWAWRRWARTCLLRALAPKGQQP